MSARIRLIIAAAGLFVAACSSAPVETTGTSVAPGDLLYGRLPATREVQSFGIEGVEGSLLDFDVRADAGNQSAPRVELIDPEGRQVDLTADTQSPDGAASMKVRGVVLLRNGTYKVNVRPPIAGQSTWYRFRHGLRFPQVGENSVRLSAAEEHPIFVSAPRRGLVAFRIKPGRGSDVVPEIRGVTDPWGGRALAKEQVPPGAHPPRLSRSMRGEAILTFTAPRPGRYTILAAAKPGTAGVVRYSATVRPAKGGDRLVYHPNTPPEFGVPGNPHGSPAPAPTTGVPGSERGVGPAPRVRTPLPRTRRMPAPPVSPLPPDPSLASR